MGFHDRYHRQPHGHFRAKNLGAGAGPPGWPAGQPGGPAPAPKFHPPPKKTLVLTGSVAGFHKRCRWTELGIANLSADDESLFSAGQVYKKYRRRKGKGKKDRVLPDFMIGAVAKTEGVALITLNDRDFVNNFKGLVVVNPTNM